MLKKPFSLHVDMDAFIPATESEKEYMVQMRPASTFFKGFYGKPSCNNILCHFISPFLCAFKRRIRSPLWHIH